MHKSQYLRMGWFIKNYVPFNEKVRVLDVGSYDLNGDIKAIINKYPNVEYIGLDMVEGPNVDYVPNDPYVWDKLEDGSFDFIISGSCFEHIEYPWLTIKEIERVLKNKGFVFILAPNTIREHRYPTDCYRYYSDGLIALANWANLNVVEASISGVPKSSTSEYWYAEGYNDSSIILTKGRDNEDLTKYPHFGCEQRYYFETPWIRRYNFLLHWIKSGGDCPKTRT